MDLDEYKQQLIDKAKQASFQKDKQEFEKKQKKDKKELEKKQKVEKNNTTSITQPKSDGKIKKALKTIFQPEKTPEQLKKMLEKAIKYAFDTCHEMKYWFSTFEGVLEERFRKIEKVDKYVTKLFTKYPKIMTTTINGVSAAVIMLDRFKLVQATLVALDNKEASVQQDPDGKNLGMYCMESQIPVLMDKALDNPDACMQRDKNGLTIYDYLFEADKIQNEKRKLFHSIKQQVEKQLKQSTNKTKENKIDFDKTEDEEMDLY